MMAEELHEKKRKQLEQDLRLAALDLIAHMGASALMIPIPNTNPVLYVALGTQNELKRLVG